MAVSGFIILTARAASSAFIVYIPPTPLAWVGLRIRELLDPIGPLARAYTAPAYLANLDEAYDEDFTGWYGGHGRGY